MKKLIVALCLVASPVASGAQPLTHPQYEAYLENQLKGCRHRAFAALDSNSPTMIGLTALGKLAVKYLNMVCAPKDSPKCVKARDEIIDAVMAATSSPPPFEEAPQ